MILGLETAQIGGRMIEATIAKITAAVEEEVIVEAMVGAVGTGKSHILVERVMVERVVVVGPDGEAHTTDSPRPPFPLHTTPWGDHSLQVLFFEVWSMISAQRFHQRFRSWW
jgi:hypothetical protein